MLFSNEMEVDVQHICVHMLFWRLRNFLLMNVSGNENFHGISTQIKFDIDGSKVPHPLKAVKEFFNLKKDLRVKSKVKESLMQGCEKFDCNLLWTCPSENLSTLCIL